LLVPSLLLNLHVSSAARVSTLDISFSSPARKIISILYYLFLQQPSLHKIAYILIVSSHTDNGRDDERPSSNAFIHNRYTVKVPTKIALTSSSKLIMSPYTSTNSREEHSFRRTYSVCNMVASRTRTFTARTRYILRSLPSRSRSIQGHRLVLQTTASSRSLSGLWLRVLISH
jgi:hypothetical protein